MALDQDGYVGLEGNGTQVRIPTARIDVLVEVERRGPLVTGT